jgi:hypothetical protein
MMGLVSGSCSLVIRGHNEIDFNYIDKYLSIKPTKVAKRKEIINKSAGEVKSDIWIHEIKMKKGDDINNTLKELLYVLSNDQNKINLLNNNLDICIRCYMQSDLAQIGVDFSPEVIALLAKLNIRLELSILSWGSVENES